jgi:hypothetical protein
MKNRLLIATILVLGSLQVLSAELILDCKPGPSESEQVSLVCGAEKCAVRVSTVNKSESVEIPLSLIGATRSSVTLESQDQAIRIFAVRRGASLTHILEAKLFTNGAAEPTAICN